MIDANRSLPFRTTRVLLLCAALLLSGCKPLSNLRERYRERQRVQELSALEPIDAHTHISAAGPRFLAMLGDLHMHMLDILYVDDTSPYRSSLDRQKADALKFIAASGGRATLCTTFDPFGWKEGSFAQKVTDSLNRDFAEGAVAAKVWKNIGMEIKDSSGKYLLPDDPIFQPIYHDIAEHNKTLIIHAAAVDAAWQPQSQDPSGSRYFEANPQWDMSTKPDAPHKKDILDARDRLLAENPNLRVVAPHLGSMEAQLDELGMRLDRYPNFAVDVSARVRNLTLLPPETVRAFLIKYQDRVLYGTDLSNSATDKDDSITQTWRKQYLLDWRYLSTDDTFDYWGRKAQGLGLPQPVLRRLYRENAMRWIPGITGVSQ